MSAIPVRNEKGQMSMEKVKVTRYMRGQRPEFAPESSSEEEEEVEVGFQGRGKVNQVEEEKEEEQNEEEEAPVDRRLRRLQQIQKEREKDSESEEEDDEDDDGEARKMSRIARHRREVMEPEVIAEGSDDDDVRTRRRRGDDSEGDDEEEEEEEEELDDEEIEKRRAARRQKVIQQRQEEEVMDVEEEKKEEEEEEESDSSEYEEYTDSEEEAGPRLKPVFVRKKDRITVQEKEREEEKARMLEQEAKRLAEERKRMTIRMANQDMKRELEEERTVAQASMEVDSDDENDEEEYELWKLRELKRIKRDREDREAIDKAAMEVERLRGMTEEERRAEARLHPKQVTNKAPKGKYKFLQKYYHRGAFFVQDEEEQVYKQDFSAPTLEDHFDKTILPKVMQVKNFGRSGRTKYTHLLDQDTTQYDAPWMQDTAQNLKFHTAKGGGMKQQFDRPATKVKHSST